MGTLDRPEIDILPYEEADAYYRHECVDDLFYAEPWLSALQKSYGYSYQMAVDRATEQFIIFTALDNLGGKKVVSLPFSDYTCIDPQATGAIVRLMHRLQQQYPTIPVVLKTTYHHTHPLAPALGTATRRAYYHQVPTQTFPTLSSSFRRGVKKAIKSGVDVTLTSEKSSLMTFYRLYHQLRVQKFNSIPQPYTFFEHVFNEFVAKGKGFLLEATREAEVIASMMVLQHKQTLYYKFGCSRMSALEHRPNNLLFDTLVRHAVDHQYVGINLGLSGTGESYEGLVRFKESMGGERHHVTYFEHCPPAYDPTYDQKFKSMLSSLTGAIVEVPLDAQTTSKLSEQLYPYFA